jgi:hypothetical protein
MFSDILFKQKIMNFLRNNKERKNTSFHNYTNQKSLFNTSNSKYTPKTKITDSLAIHKLSRNTNNIFNISLLKNETKKNINSFFNLTSPREKHSNEYKNRVNPYNKINNKFLFKKKSDLILRKYFEEKEKVFPWKNPFKDYKDPLFIYEILHFQKNEKNKTINTGKKTSIYENIFKKKNKEDNNKNSKSLSFDRKKFTNILIKKVDKEQIIKNIKEIRKQEIRKNILIELKDEVLIPSLKKKKFNKIINKFLTNEIDIKEIINSEKFYKNFENKINFIFDSMKLPVIKNNLVKRNIDVEENWNYLNAIESLNFLYLNQLKLKIQKENDKKKINKSKNKNEDKIKKIKLFLSKENTDHELDNFDKDFLFDVNGYFTKKDVSFKNVQISNNLLKDCVYNKFDNILEEINNSPIIL